MKTHQIFTPPKPRALSFPPPHSRADLSRKQNRYIFSGLLARRRNEKEKEKKNAQIKRRERKKKKKKELSRNARSFRIELPKFEREEKRFARRETIQTILRFIFSPSLLLHLFFTSLSRDVRIDRLHLHNIIVYLFRRLLLKRSPVSLITLMSLHEYTLEYVCTYVAYVYLYTRINIHTHMCIHTYIYIYTGVS